MLVYTHSVTLVIEAIWLVRYLGLYSPLREWIMCEHDVFAIFLENDLLKIDKILLGLTFKARKDWKDSKRHFFIFYR